MENSALHKFLTVTGIVTDIPDANQIQNLKFIDSSNEIVFMIRNGVPYKEYFERGVKVGWIQVCKKREMYPSIISKEEKP